MKWVLIVGAVAAAGLVALKLAKRGDAWTSAARAGKFGA